MVIESELVAATLGLITVGAAAMVPIGGAPGEWGRGVLLSTLLVFGTLYAGALGSGAGASFVALVSVVALSIAGVSGLALATAIGIAMSVWLFSSGAMFAGGAMALAGLCGVIAIARQLFASGS